MKLPTKNPYLLAPMEEVNDIAFRLLCKKAGAGLTYTGMLNPLTKQKFYLDDKPILQLFCTDTKGIKEFMKKHDSLVAGWDFNLGCPAKTARKHGFGVFLHNDPEKIENILKVMRDSTKKPLSVKLRKSKHTMKIAKMAEKYCDAIAIHPRTQSQGYGGVPDIEFAKRLKKRSKVPVIYSGDVNLDNHEELLKTFDYLMIGRKAIGNPDIFAELLGRKSNTNFNDYLTIAAKYKLPFRQIKIQAMGFTKGLRDATKLRLEIFKTRKIQDIKKLLTNRIF